MLRRLAPLALLLATLGLAPSAAAQEPPVQGPAPHPQLQPSPALQPGPPQQGHPQQGHPQQGHPQQAYPQQGHPQQAYPQPGHPQQPPAASAVGEPRRPQSVEEYARTRRALRLDLKRANRDDRDDDVERIERQIDLVDDWYREDVKRRSGGAFVAGIVMTGVGGLSLLTGLGLVIAAQATDAANVDRDVVRGLDVAASVTLISGVGLLGGGIPLIVWGSERVMVRDEASSTGSFAVGPTGARFVATF